MRDDSQRWAPPRDRTVEISAPGVRLRALDITRLTLISGRRACDATDLPFAAWPDLTSGDSYAIVLRRDRILEVNGPERPDGWDSKACLAISDATAAYCSVELSGPNAHALLNRGTDLDLATPSRSAARLLFGLGVFLYRHDGADTYRIHTGTAQDEALWHAISDAACHLSTREAHRKNND
ncbi:MAG: hypothetical protein AAF231_15290 [Pseudomonadota bacterium]